MHSKVPGIKYRTLLHHLSLVDVSPILRGKSRKRIYPILSSHMVLRLRGGEIPRNRSLKKVSCQQEFLEDRRASTPLMV